MNPAQSEAADVLAEWKAAYAEVFPHRNPEAMRVDDADLALAVMLRREVRAAATITSVEPVCVADIPSPYKLRGKILHSMSNFNPKDPE